jgi:hypothetical protein
VPATVIPWSHRNSSKSAPRKAADRGSRLDGGHALNGERDPLPDAAPRSSIARRISAAACTQSDLTGGSCLARL